MSDDASPFHHGELAIQSRAGVRDEIERLGRELISDQMSAADQELLSRLPLFIIGAADAAGRPWASMLVGSPGFLRAVDIETLRVGARPVYGDVLERALGEGAEIGGLGMEFSSRSRCRINGRVTDAGEDGFSIRIAQSFGNGPKYIQARELRLADQPQAPREQHPVRCGKTLGKADAALIAGADTFFIASRSGASGDDPNQGMDVSHRGGPQGFVIVAHETLLLFPDYPGSGMFSTLGNLMIDPRCGVTFLDFDSGDVLQVTGEADILWEPHHTNRFPGAERVIALRVDDVRCLDRALPVKAEFLSPSPDFESLQTLPGLASGSDDAAPMQLMSVNVSGPKDVNNAGKIVRTGIFKEPVEGRVTLRRLNLDGDGQADLWGHGGAFRAVYAYSKEAYDHWSRELGRDFAPGSFGENFTVEGMPDDKVHVGDIYRIGNALVEVSQPRIPCFKLALKLGIPDFQKRFLEGRRVGFYLRVLEEGEFCAGQPIELVSRDPGGLTVAQVNALLFFDRDDLDGTRKALSIPALSHGWKESFEERLAKADEPAESATGFRPFRVDRKVAESETITSFYLVPEDGKPLPAFLPGQFLSFRLEIPGQPKPVLRTYSLSDAPSSDHYRVSIKREAAPAEAPDVPPGLSSNFFHDQVAQNTLLEVGPPRGKFHIDPESDRALVLLSAGVGLTPMVAIANTVMQGGATRRVWFIHGARNGREHAMGPHMRMLAEQHDNLNVHVRYSQPDDTDVPGRDHDGAGRVDIALLKQLLPFDDYEFYLCGPTLFMRSLYCGLLETGVSEARIHYEFFGPGSLLVDEGKPVGPTTSPSTESELTGEVQVTFARSGLTVSWDPAAGTILDLAEQNGLSLDYSCRSGICQTCICDLIEGEVEYTEEPLDPPSNNRVLICCARPSGTVIIDV